MEQKTGLLEYLLREAEALWRADGKAAMTGSYFLVSLLNLILALLEECEPAELGGVEYEGELAKARELLAAEGLSPKRTRDALLAESRKEDNLDRIDEFGWSKTLFRLRKGEKREGPLDVPTVLEVVLELRTPGMRTAFAADVAKEEKKPQRKRKAASPAKETAEPPAKETPGFSLSEAVKKADEISRELLLRVVGQDMAIAAFTAGYFQGQLTAAAEGKRHEPHASFLFAGPPGVGKTYLAECAAEVLGLPFLRVDMSEYSDQNSVVEFAGSDKVYRNGKEGNITRFVRENPECVILFDEVEKADISIIHLFLQILDSGSIRDNYTDEAVSFTGATVIFTTNVGRRLYEDPAATNLALIPRKKVLSALAEEKNPRTGAPMFPGAICSRFAAGNVLMFNRLGTDNLYRITQREITAHTAAFSKTAGIAVTVDEHLPTALILAAGGRADARTVRGRAATVFHEETYELLRLMSASGARVSELSEIRLEVDLAGATPEVAALFEDGEPPKILVFAEAELRDACRFALPGCEVLATGDPATARALLFQHDITLALCDVRCGVRGKGDALNAEDVDSDGQDFLAYLLSAYPAVPAFLLTRRAGEISPAEFLSFARMGVRETVTPEGDGLAAQVGACCCVSYRQRSVMKLAREGKLLSYKTAQTLSKDGRIATVSFNRLRLARTTDAEDGDRILDVSARPDVHFADVIGAEDAKRELSYFSEFLKDPRRYARRGLAAPKGVLLYGPPGTGKTLLAKALAGESDVAFLATEGNRFLRPYRGEGVAAVHELFRTARKYAPAILFVDEIDTIGKDRAEGRNDELVGDVLTAFLTEMDGFSQDPTRPVFVLAATNYGVGSGTGKALDPALLRRFDRRIYVDLPNREERERFLRLRLERSPAFALSESELESIAERSLGMSLAGLDSVLEMALRHAVHSEDGTVGDDALEEAFEAFTGGEARTRSREAIKRTAYHEAGHALLSALGGECPAYVSVVSRGDHGGYMQHGGSEDKLLFTRDELLLRIRTALAGRAAELVFFGEEDGVTTGASGDLSGATALAEQMLCSYGMDDGFGLAVADPSPTSPLYPEVRRRVNELLERELANAKQAVAANRETVGRLVEALLLRNHLRRHELIPLLKDIKS